MKTLKNWTLSQHADHFVELKVDNRHLLRLYVLESGLMRVLLKRDGELALNRTWSIAPGDDVPWGGAIANPSTASGCRTFSWSTRRTSCASAPTGCA